MQRLTGTPSIRQESPHGKRSVNQITKETRDHIIKSQLEKVNYENLSSKMLRELKIKESAASRNFGVIGYKTTSSALG